MKGSGNCLGDWIKSPNRSITKVPRLITSSLEPGSSTVLFHAEGGRRSIKHPSVLSDDGKSKKQMEITKRIHELPMGHHP